MTRPTADHSFRPNDRGRGPRLVAALAMILTALVTTAGPTSVGAETSDGVPGTYRNTAAALSAGDDHTCVVDEYDTVRCWGAGDAGQLGSGSTADVGDAVGEMGFGLAEVDLGTGRTAIAVAAGASHTCALLDNGTVTCWGAGGNGRLGHGSTADIGDGPGEMGDSLPTVDLGAGRIATAITTGDAHTCALLENGSVKCWGNGADGRLGSGSTADIGDGPGEMGTGLPALELGTGRSATAISAGRSHTCAVLDNGDLKCWGDSASGRLGNSSAAADLGDAADEMGDALPAVDLGTDRTAEAVSAGRAHTCAVLDNGDVKCWGSGADGRLGNDDTANIGDGVGPTVSDANPVDLGTGRTATGVIAGGSHTCAVLDTGLLTCWGNGSDGRLGNEATTNIADGVGPTVAATTPIYLGPRAAVVQMTIGASHTCALLDDDTVRCWGRNVEGQLGTGDTTPYGEAPGQMGNALPVIDLGTGRAPVLIDTGYSTTCALFDDGAVKCWGNDPFSTGSLGNGSTDTIGDEPGEMGDDLDPIDLGSGRTAIDLAVGPNHACVVLDDHSVKCWGSEFDGALGNGASGAALGDEPGEMGDNLPTVALPAGRSADAVAADGYHTCALLDDASIICWGGNSNGELGQGNTTNIGDGIGPSVATSMPIDLGPGRTAVDVVVGQSHACAVLDGGDMKCWGEGSLGELGSESSDDIGNGVGIDVDMAAVLDLGTDRSAAYVSIGWEYSCAVLDDASARCWGRGSEGRRGSENIDNVGSMVGDMGDNLAPVELGTGRTAIQVAAGNAHTCAVLDDGNAKCWGYNFNGQLGAGSTSQIGDQIDEMGDDLAPIPIAPSRRILPITVKAPTTGAFASLAPERFVDTREVGETLDDQYEKEGKRAADSEYRVQIVGRGSVPTGATAAIVNITAIQAEDNGFVTAHPCVDPKPLASSLNYTAGVNLGNEVIAPLSSSGEICLYTFASAHLTVDVTGFVSSASPVTPITPGRFLDTRPAPVSDTVDNAFEGGGKPAAGSTTTLDIAGRDLVPADAAAVIVNVTAITPEDIGFVTVHPCLETPPLAASLNYVAGVNRGNEIIATLDGSGDICLFTSASTHLSADVVGFLPAGTDVTPIGPSRLLDSRPGQITFDGEAQAIGKRSAGSEYTLDVAGRGTIPPGATSAVINITAIQAEGLGFITVHPCLTERPNTASLNYIAGVNGGNEIVTQLNGAGEVCIYTSERVHLTADIVATT